MMVACRKSVSRATGASGAFDANEDNNANKLPSQEKSFVLNGFPAFFSALYIIFHPSSVSVRICSFLSPFG